MGCGYQHIIDLLVTLIPMMYVIKKVTKTRRGPNVHFRDHLGGAVRDCAGCPPRLQCWPTRLQISDR
ncbi:hypothetical protein Y032_0272g921 [Ancylostoma ceylanicum]|uniref:Uncharacterized protein n=1 Tax=Ancylostoma ceylanicum TaxID=53326 RepID=A0A016S848_9BILA|nr:hypothetical protein Y032_0272g921 [Ancylostoma ceylanicum]